MLFAGDTFAIKWHGIARAAIIAAKQIRHTAINCSGVM